MGSQKWEPLKQQSNTKNLLEVVSIGQSTVYLSCDCCQLISFSSSKHFLTLTFPLRPTEQPHHWHPLPLQIFHRARKFVGFQHGTDGSFTSLSKSAREVRSALQEIKKSFY